MGAPGDPKHGYIFSNAILGLKEAEIAKMCTTTPFLVENRRSLRFLLSECQNSNAVYSFGVRTFENSTKIAQNLKKRLFPSKKSFMKE